ncbi:unnamed protein product [Nesidiocoris tenuis]|uniref:Sodium/calcium exchanger membrane region domain-containing protein n=1 Tax=Nesidiocoris tenuis TaxID=355587 RepID=A0A6H5H865_9HEMI|nr:unnamed protein product [Nesidiocoris tenuis]
MKHILSVDEGCSSSSVDNFPDLPLPGGPVTSTIITLAAVGYLFVFLVRVCDKHFVSCIKTIGKTAGLSSDVAGATLMAAAVSCPDLFINLIGTFVTHGDIGIGTIVGCGIFNTLAVPALCVLIAPSKSIRLKGWSLSRDSLFYCAALVMLCVALTDNKIEWYEALTLVLIYLFYIADRSFVGQLCYFLTLPIDVILGLTIPKSTKTFFGFKLYPITFTVCLLWIAAVSYVIAWLITIAGFELRIPDSLVGLSFIAIGMSVPQAASSIIIAKQGDGAMALSNAIGSNVFDNLICLGLPWFLKCLIYEENFVEISSLSISYSFVILISSLLILYMAAALNDFRLNRTIGILLLCLYVLFAMLSASLELNIFFVANLPFCL